MQAHARDDARNISQGASLSRRALLRLRVFLLAVLYVVPGLVGHDPWKQDETYATSIVHHIAQTGDWVVPTSAGQPFIEKPPLYYLVATATAKVGIGAVTLAAAATLAWLGTVAWIQRTRLAGVFAWALGITLLWMLAATLLLPWLNAAKSYRSMFDDMREHLPAQFDCVASIHLGESEAAMLEYEGGIVAIPP